MKIAVSRNEVSEGAFLKPRNPALTALSYVARAGLMAASFYSFIAASDILRDFRILDGALPIDSWRPPLTQSELAWGVPVWGFGLGVTAYADHAGRRVLRNDDEEFTPFELFVNKHGGALAAGAWTGVFAAGAIATMAGAILL